MNLIRDAADGAHRALWQRYFPQNRGVLVDYAGEQGELVLPSPEDHHLGRPNALGWWSAAENGPFFTGLYLHGLMDRVENEGGHDLLQKAHRLAQGLETLALPGGFIARGLGEDGKSHYPASSSDQTYPWFLGLWRYASSSRVPEEDRERVKNLWFRQAEALRKKSWRLHGDPISFGHFGDLSGEPMAEKGEARGEEPAFDAVARLLFIHKAAGRLSGDPRWEREYRKLLLEINAETGLTRLDVLEKGASYVEPGANPRYPVSTNLWTSASSQGALEALAILEEDPSTRACFKRGLRKNAQQALAYLPLFENYRADHGLTFTSDWRPLNDLWYPQHNAAEAVAVATRQYGPWHQTLCPGKHYENRFVRDPLFAAWVLARSGEGDLVGPSRPTLEKMLRHFPYPRLFGCAFFMAENLAAALMAPCGKPSP
ncbi:MAG: hypothetical protein J0L75_05025 [Spirochaetes bacterium]|nr:hypothetical protein [Spirochaetota bacterium]